jgi:outer membrane biosynthesis protein TonB
MPKKIDEAEVKKECPSCGLGVALDSTICEFCGWDFEEEDEWILQIEKLERDLMLEKQKFEPGSVNERIESTLHSPTVAMQEAAKPAPEPVVEAAPEARAPASKRMPARETKKPVPSPEPVVERPAPAKPAPSKPVVATVSEPESRETASTKVRRVRVAKSAPAQEEPQERVETRRRLVRKVKQKG